MVASLEEIRARLRAQEEKKGGNYSGDNTLFPHWNIPENSTAVVRFLPDGDDDNDFFWRERQVIKLPFAGIKGGDSKPVTVEVPCMHTWGESCPVTEEIKPWWNDEALKDTARVYYKKRSFIYQGLVVSSNLEEDPAPASPIRRLVMGRKLHDMIKASLMDPELDVLPIDFDDGIDFRITRTKDGQYSSYDTSAWSRKNRSLTDEERAAIDEHGLFNLSDFLPKKPSEKELQIIMEMFESSVNGDAYDPDRFASYYKPFGLNNTSNNQTTSEPKKPAVAPTKAPVAKEEVEETSVPSVSAEASEPKATKSPADLIAEIKNRNKAKDNG